MDGKVLFDIGSFGSRGRKARGSRCHGNAMDAQDLFGFSGISTELLG